MNVNWYGLWIGAPDWRMDARSFSNHPVAFRSDLELASKPQNATLRIAVSTRFQLWINGETILRGPARSWPARTFYDELDIASFLQDGRNAIAVLVQTPTESRGYAPSSRFGLLISGEVECDDGAVTFGTNGEWKSRSADWISSHGLLTSLPTGFQHHLDAALEPKNWQTEPAEEGWSAPFVLGPVGTPPWFHLEPRPVPMLEETVFDAPLVWLGNDNREQRDIARNLSALFNDSEVQGEFVHDKLDWLQSGEHNLFTFDYGKTRMIQPIIEVEQVSGEARVEIYYDLALEDRPTAMRGFGGYEEGFCDSFLLNDSNRVLETLLPRGFRFLTVRVAGQGEVRFRPICKTVEYPYPQKARFRCDDPFWQQVWDTSVENLRSSTNDVFVDTCARENVLWTLDACVAGLASFHTFGETAMWRHCLKLVGEGISAEGVPHAVVPAGDSFMMLFDQTLHWVVSCYEYSLHTGDASLLPEVAPAIERFLVLCEAHITEENLFVPPPYSWYWYDWVSADKRAYSLTINVLLLRAANAALRIDETCNDDNFNKIASRIVQRIHPNISRFWDEEAHAFRSRLEPKIEMAAPHPMSRGWDEAHPHALHGNILAYETQCGTEEQHQAVVRHAARILEYSKEPYDVCGPAWTNILFEPMMREGYGADVLKFLKRLLAPALECGAPTWGETFHPAKFNTAHGWGAALNSLIVEGVVGLRPLEAGYKRIQINPCASFTCDFTYELDSPSGKIVVQRRGGEIHTECSSNIEVLRDRKAG